MSHHEVPFAITNAVCSDCGLSLDAETVSHWGERHTPDHDGRCCDCFDERCGMPAEKRDRPRPEKEGA